MRNLIKNNKGKLILSSVLILLPILAGVILWNDLPAQMATHWGIDNAADGWGGRLWAILAPPIFLLAAHWLCLLVTAADPKNREQHPKALGMVFWICPITSWFTSAIVYAAAFGMQLHLGVFTMLFLGILFILIGNYLPKCRQNRTLGIKVKWALSNEENWNRTHRFAGKVWVIGGLGFMACAFLPETAWFWAVMIGAVLLAVIPTLYSYLYYQKQLAAGTASKISGKSMSRVEKAVTAVVLAITAIVLVITLILAFSGDYEILYGDTSFTVEASGWSDLTVEYAAVESLEYRDRCTFGSRAVGYGTPSLLMGSFQNEEFGAYTLYARPSCESAVVLTVDGKILVLNGKDDTETREIYDTLSAQIAK